MRGFIYRVATAIVSSLTTPPLVAGVPTGAVGIELADILVHVISKPLGIDAGQFDAQMLDIELTLRRALSSRKARASWGKARSAVKRYFHCSLCLVLLDLFATADTDGCWAM